MRLDISADGLRDISTILDWSRRHFGEASRDNYEQLIEAGFQAILQPAPPLASKTVVRRGRTLHLFHLRGVRAGSRVRNPRHVIVYAIGADILVLRLLHDAMDLPSRLRF